MLQANETETLVPGSSKGRRDEIIQVSHGVNPKVTFTFVTWDYATMLHMVKEFFIVDFCELCLLNNE